MANLPPLRKREVIIGGGVHAQVYAATREALGFAPPAVLEKTNRLGGVFAQVSRPFWLNSVNAASLRSTEPGPTRIRPRSPSDDLNWFPNCEHQVRAECMTEYPASNLVASVVRRNLRKYAEVFTSCDVAVTGVTGTLPVITVDGAEYECGRLVDARGVTMKPQPGSKPGTCVITAMDYLTGLRPALPQDATVAVVGDGDTSCVVIEDMLGLGPEPRDMSVSGIGWYGPALFLDKAGFIEGIQARYLGIGRHLPQEGITGMIEPFPERARVASLGSAARVNNRTYDLAVLCTGFTPDFAGDSVSPAALGIAETGTALWRSYQDRYFMIGACASVSYRTAEAGRGYVSFPRNSAAIFRLAPETARLAASLPDVA